MLETAPVLQVALELDGVAWEKLEPSTGRIAEAVHAVIGRMMEALGVPGRPNVVVRAATGPGKWLRLRIGGHLCRYPDVLLNHVRAYATGFPPDPGLDAAKIQYWFADSPEPAHESAMPPVALACAAILERHPAALMQDRQAGAYLEKLEQAAGRPTDGAPPSSLIQDALREALEARCSVANTELARRALVNASGGQDEVGERLVQELRSRVVEIRAAPGLYESLAAARREQELFPFLREGLYEELGFFYPELRLVPDKELQPSTFRFRINALDTFPILSPGSGKILVNDTVERLSAINVDATATLNVATNHPSAIVDAQEKELLEKKGLTTWDEWGFVILALADTLRRNAVCFVDSAFVQLQLRNLERVYPKLVTISRRDIPIHSLTAILRGLIQEQVSIRDLKTILERVLDSRYAHEAQSRYLVLDDRLTIRGRSMLPPAGNPNWIVEFVRQGMKAQLSHKLTLGTGTLVVYLLDSKIEQMLGSRDAEDGLPAEADQTRILEAIHAEIAHLPATAQIPFVMTTGAVRPVLQRILALEIPVTRALSHGEVSRDTNIQPIARISV